MPETMSLDEARQEHEKTCRTLTSARARLSALYEGSRKQDGGGWEVAPHVAEEIRTLEGQCKSLEGRKQAAELDILAARNTAELDRLKNAPAPGAPPIFARSQPGEAATASVKAAPESYGDALVNHPSYKSWEGQSRNHFAIEISHQAHANALKATLTSSGLTAYERVPGVFGIPQRALRVADLLPKGQTNGTTVRILQESGTRTHSAGMVAEGAAKPEQSFTFAEVDSPVRKIAAWTKMTDEMRADYPAARDFVNAQLPFEIEYTEEVQLLTGDGTGQNLLGMLNVVGIQTQPAAGDPNPDAIFKAGMKIITQFFNPSGVVIHPNNWQAVRLLKTTDGAYVWGHPSIVGPDTIFGWPVVVTTAITANTALVADFGRASQIFYREGVVVEMTNTDQNDFILNLVTVRGHKRLAFPTYYPKAICSVTGLT